MSSPLPQCHPLGADLPTPLKRGDRVRLVAASSALSDSQRLEAGLAVLESWGLEPEGGFDRQRRWGYLAGKDEHRRADFEPHPELGPAGLRACVRGGWGAARLLEHPLDLAPGWLLGFSDVTSLLWAQRAQGHGGGIHGPLITTLAAEPAWSRQRLHDLLFGAPLEDLRGEEWRGGVAEGPLLVANLTVATHLLGTPHLPPLQGAVLVLEDVGEAPYRVDRMLTHWRLTGALHQLAGLGFGRFSDDGESDQTDDEGAETGRREERFSTEQVLKERSADLGIPVLGGLDVGHGPGNAALPLGARARLDGSNGRLSLLA
ncbi:LD-carboxypeptidase [Cyanobium sp. Morenito 9A2]|uniref:S66 peptidase family protein n=1 Tax=Cyanobium sp. Morenito 9A2 TaxID=2823718 RepID=UPI0020CE56AE|nr:LD-carboxypeptidase [Cyanobium sp. Morenito 9A2]MCP9848289.1 LD-carboxypeptidase [Cyanobium sp. Morenito 9A2]